MSFLEVQPVLLIGCLAALFWYVRGLQALRGESRWPKHRTLSFVAGLVLVLAVTDGGLTAETHRLFWVWLSQALLLLLVLPIPLLAGQPIELARSTPGRLRLTRLADTGIGRLFSSPVVGAALIPLASVVFLFGPVPGWAISNAPAGWLIQAAMLIVGLLIVLPLISTDATSSSLAIGAAIAVGFVELLVDAIPGIVMRLSTHPVTSFFDLRTPGLARPNWLHDQQFAGGILWCVAELLDLPFLILIFRRWVQADAREAARADAGQVDRGDRAGAGGASAGAYEEPWFLTDPQLRDRFGHRRG
ncbi:MAG: cytochrome c oxidase assembly protein [Frankiales bacterium]|nr:cytochrome c oxidase assembly protein [Frankiales bacterium]